MEEYLDSIRPALINRRPLNHLDAKRHAFQNSFEIPGLKKSAVYATSLVAGDPSELADVEGEHGNPSVMLWTPGRIQKGFSLKLRDDSHVGWCGGIPTFVFPKAAFVYFTFVPNKTDIWHLNALINFHGFYRLTLSYNAALCRFAEVKLDVSMNVYQYFWLGAQTYHLINERQQHLGRGNYQYVLYDDYPNFLDYTAPLKADDKNFVLVQVIITISAGVYGFGSYAEINFEDGSANYIEPVTLLAWPNSI